MLVLCICLLIVCIVTLFVCYFVSGIGLGCDASVVRCECGGNEWRSVITFVAKMQMMMDM